MADMNDNDDDQFALLRKLNQKLGVDPDMAQKQVQFAMDSANNVGSVGKIGALGKLAGAAEQAAPVELSMADKIRQAAANSNVKVIPSAEDKIAQQFADKYKNAPSFFEKYGKQAADAPASTVPEEQARLYQQQLRDEALANRNAQQLGDRKDINFQQLLQMIKGGGK